MKHRGIRIAILCVMSVLLALAPLGCAEENVDGGLFAIFYDDRFLSLACKFVDDALCTYNSDILKELAQIGTKVEVVDLETKNRIWSRSRSLPRRWRSLSAMKRWTGRG